MTDDLDLRNSLERSARAVVPSDRLADIKSAVTRSRRRRRALDVSLAVAVVAAVAVGLVWLAPFRAVTVATTPATRSTPEPNPSTGTMTRPSPSPVEDRGQQIGPLPDGYATSVFRVWRDAQGEPALIRELVRVREVATMNDQEPTHNPTLDAVRTAMFGVPNDPSVVSVWRRPQRLLVTQGETGVVIDMSPDAIGPDPGPTEAKLALQQLVWTASASAVEGSALTPVTILVGGKAATIWGVPVGTPMLREPAATVLSNWVETPRFDQRSSGPTTITGYASTPDGTVHITIETSDHVVSEQSLSGQPRGVQAAFSTTVDLPPGRYTVTVSTGPAKSSFSRPFEVID